MFDEIFVKSFPGFLSVRNSKHQIVYLNQNFKEWIKQFSDIDPMGKTNQEIADTCEGHVADVFCQCHDGSLDWQKNCSSKQSLKKTLVFKDAEARKENTQYFDALKYGMTIDGEQYIFTVCYDVTGMYSELLSSYENHAKELERIAYVDDLTGASTLAKFKLDVQQALQNNPDTSYVIVKFDIAGFKLINDQYGFQMGDMVIKKIAKATNAILEYEEETFGRVNVDEFVLFLRYSSDEKLNNIRNMQKKFLNQLLTNFNLDFNFKLPTGQYKIPLDRDANENITTIFEKVNFAHRKAKESVTETIVDYDDSIKISIFKEQEIESKMESALLNHEFKLFLQPKYLLHNEKIGGAEALVRWSPSDIPIMYPSAFIPIFEKNGFITKLDMFMFEETCKWIRVWLDDGITPPKVSVNFSRLHLVNENFVDEICELCNKYNVPHEYIEIELTESIMMENEELLTTMLSKLHKHNFTISMDDFGTGYSSLGLLKNIPVDVIKIDRSFFLSAQDNDRAKAVLMNVFNLAHDLKINTVAEGVEEKAHIDMLKDMGCDMVQGYYYAKPMPTDELGKML
ncbi:MAG: putative bifunctional diguanylate cyclase/phosphodiesterase [Lachnospiraceae bacterium]